MNSINPLVYVVYYSKINCYSSTSRLIDLGVDGVSHRS